MIRVLALIGLALTLLWSSQAQAHLVQVGYSQLLLRHDGLMLFSAPPIEVVRFADTDHDGRISTTEIDAHRAALQAQVQQHIAVIADDPAHSVYSPAFIDLLAANNGHASDTQQFAPLTAVLFFPVTAEKSQLSLRYSWFPTSTDQPDAITPMRVVVAQLNGKQHVLQFSPDSTEHRIIPTRMQQFQSLWWAGLEHIAFGLDHLVFLTLLVLTLSGWRAWLAVVTAFTLGHACTIFLAPYVPIPGHYVEIAIALSILWVGWRNWAPLRAQRAEPATRSVVHWTLLGGIMSLGMLHGLGFAGSLAQSGLLMASWQDSGLPLLAFNLGIEAVQLLYLMAMAALLHGVQFLAQTAGLARFKSALNALGLVAALYWTVSRLVL